MGIFKFFSWFSSRGIFRGLIERNVPPQVDILAIDANALIYNNLHYLKVQVFQQEGNLVFSQEEFYRKRLEVFQGVLADIIGLTTTIKPRRSLIIAFDGVAPQAKINQQRGRRYKAAAMQPKDAVFDPNEITPGTDFMIDLDRFLREELKKITNQTTKRSPGFYNFQPPPHILYSSHLVPGEGEHKIADRLRQIPSANQTVVVHGMDADLFMINLLRLRQGWNDIYLFRDHSIETSGPRNYRIESIISLRKLEQTIKLLFPNVEDPVDDFVTIIFFVGNDFLPHFPSFELIQEALDALIFGYQKFLIENPKFPGITSNGRINWKSLALFLEYIHQNYDNDLLQKWGTNASGMIKFPSSVAEKCIVTSRLIGDESRCTRILDLDSFRKEWYNYIFGSKIYGTILPTQEDINRLIEYYLEGLAWVHSYYYSGPSGVDLGWYYPNHYAPLFSDLYAYIKSSPSPKWEILPLYTRTEPISPLEQLVMVLPPRSIKAVPLPLHILYTEKSPIYDLFPSGFLVDSQGKMEEYESIALLPFPNPSRVKLAIQMLNLSPEFVSQFNPQSPIDITSDLFKLMAQPPTQKGISRTQAPFKEASRGRSQAFPRSPTSRSWATPKVDRPKQSGRPRGAPRPTAQWVLREPPGEIRK